KSDKDLMEKMQANGEEKPSLIIFDLNNNGVKPLTLIPKLKSKLKKGTSIIGFLSHVQGDLKQKAHEVGCDMVLPRSAFSQNLPQLLRRHGAPEDAERTVRYPCSILRWRAIVAAARWQRPMISASLRSASFNPAKCRFGMMSTWVGACGLTSSNAKTCSSSKTFFDGISPRMMRQKRQLGS